MHKKIAKKTKIRKGKDSKAFWDKEYREPSIFNLSIEPAEDVRKFARWIERKSGKGILSNNTNVLDLGTGNGRNLIWLARTFGVKGVGYDISNVAILQAKNEARGLPLSFEARSIAGIFDLADNSVDIVLDMMTSHYLKEAERKLYLNEISRVLSFRGWLLFKSFLLEEDRNAARLLRESPAGEDNAYLHPRHGQYEYVWEEEKMRNYFSPNFEIEKVERSGKHLKDGRAFKRRHIVAYMSRKWRD
ncbi:MAG: hypothetical protein COV07_02115 [Candidatus Vogelbacteria bacterium CG10_big_fil_rev_8_21_14_0_10_45_14]|uniref:Methyltransferase domain-containing protein n=1 Tax=Candidatus Vogelbacteria bacterium CG10_big_fil_rev_8_21_14_0_10_45_14 TaxID=1975042 RepID=A0A2H0RK13_9BACT|nr:MAG: hypothetical protein COV07_02115 [Candidatus Vogelbacteria bacterium CG10_big_fil_rev_8_21_14_0_10_45_14]